MRMARFSGRVFRGFRFLGVGALVMSDCLGSVCFRMMIVAAQVPNVAARNRQQPKPDTSRRSDAESERKLLLAVRHAFRPLNYHRDCHAHTQEYLLVHGLHVLCFRSACCWRLADSVFVQNDFPAICTDAIPNYASARATSLWGINSYG